MLPPGGDDVSARRSALFCSLVTLALTVMALSSFYKAEPQIRGGEADYVLTHSIPWIVGEDQETPTIDIGYRVGVDGISIWLVLLTSLLMPLAIWSGFSSLRPRV